MTGERTTALPGHEAGTQPALRVRRASKRYGLVTVLDDVDLDILPGQIHALVGENGSGKSTFIKALSGYHALEPGGSIAIGGHELSGASAEGVHALGARFVQQDLGLIDSLTVTDNFLLSSGFPSRLLTVADRQARRTVRAALAKVGLDVDPRAPVGLLTAAEKTELAIARALYSDATTPLLLVLDEPTATLPSDEVDRLVQTLRRVAAGGCAILYVSHRLEEVLALTSWVTVLRDGQKVASRSTEGLTHDELVKLLVGRDLRETEEALRESLDERAAVITDREPVLRVEGLAVGPLDRFSFAVRPGDILGIAGINGSGRESVLPAVFAGAGITAGTVTVKGSNIRRPRPQRSKRAGMAYLPPDRKTLSGLLTMSARENLTIADLRSVGRRLKLSRRREVVEAENWFAKLDVRPAAGIEADLSSFSGGNQQKILLAKWLRCHPAVLLLDEPTQGVDIGAKSEIYRHIVAAAAAGAAVVVTSTDVKELESLCNRVIILRNGQGSELPLRRISAAQISRECVRLS